MLIKKIFSALLILSAGVCVFSGCGSTASGNGNDPINSENLIRIGIINNDPNESGYRTANVNDMKKVFTEDNGYSPVFYYSLKNDEQISAARKFIQDEVDYLLISAASTSGWESVLKDARDQEVKVILFDRSVDADPDLYEASVISDMEKQGDTAVKWLSEQNYSEYNIVHIQGVIGSSAQIGRSKALENAVDTSSSWNLVSRQAADWSAENAQQIVQSVIDSGKKFNVIYAENDDMAKGAVAALDKANISHGPGKEVAVIGFDCNKWALKELLDQNWNFDVQCNPYQAEYIDIIIKEIENGKEITQKTTTIDEKGLDAVSITAEDIEKYGI